MRGLGLAFVLGLCGMHAAAAAQPAPAPTPVTSEPASTSATYGDWVLRCQRVGEGSAARKVCEVAQTIRMPEQRDPVAEVALGRLPVEKALHVTTLLPPNVSFPSSVMVAAADKAGASIDLQWRRCLTGGCFADGAAPDDLIKAWRSQTSAGKMTFKDAAGREIALPVSFRGLAQALDALDRA